MKENNLANPAYQTTNNDVGPFRIIDLPPGRRVMINMLSVSGSKHSMYGLLEVDVTVARRFIAEYKARTGETLSFTGFLAFCLAQAVDEDKTVQAYLKNRKQLVLFENVDISLMVEGKIGEKRVLMGHIIREANHKTYQEIHQEIRSVQSKEVPKNRGLPTWFRIGMLLPWPLSKVFNVLVAIVLDRDPAISVQVGGTVGISAIGMFGEGHGGWGVFPLPQTLGLVAGNIAWKPLVIEGRIEPREILHLTVMFDHKIVDGAPAARFTKRLVELIENGYGLDEYQTATYVKAETESAVLEGG